MLQVICWKWKQSGYRSKFTAEHVNVLRSMVKRNLRIPHEFCCLTDESEGIEKGIRILSLPASPVSIGNPHRPNCYRRLWAFSKEAKEVIGDRFLSLDLDCVITGDITHIVDREEDFVIWGDTAANTYYNGSMFLLTAGSREDVWTTFDPKTSPGITYKMRMVGSDQAWIGACLGPHEAMWKKTDGVYSYRVHISKNKSRLPDNAKVVFFHGQHDPWNLMHIDWIAQHWKL